MDNLLDSKKILVVDDESDIREVLRESLEKSKAIVFEAANGLAALEIIQSQDIDIVVSDVRMPKLDGVQLLKELQTVTNKAGKTPAIFIITGYAHETTREVYDLGAKAVLSKPFDMKIVADVINQFLLKTQNA